MDVSSYQPVTWIPWKKMNVLMPIKKKTPNSYRYPSQISNSNVKEENYLPKLKVKKLYCIYSRHVSPSHHINKKKYKNKVFSPILNRGGTIDFSKSLTSSLS